ncbi:MAG: replicative DNA helicase, partial [Bacteroidetes bacterium]|nr:replicative DNA helicase [Bacteroidota bacterium]
MSEQKSFGRPKKKTTLSDQTSQPFINEYGKLPPQATDLEEAILGAIMLEKEVMDKVSQILRPEAFYKETHQMIFEACLKLADRVQPIDIITVTQELRKMEKLDIVGGPFAITQLTNRVASAAHVEYHARIIAQKHIQRELIRISSEIQTEAYKEENDVFELLDDAEKKLFAIAEGNIS